MAEQDFIKAGFKVVGTETSENKLISYLKENYPSVIKDNEINLNELKAIAGLPIDEKVNGYGLNFVGRNFARAKYTQKTEKELRLNASLSKNIDTTQNLVLKGDNLDSLRILKNHYNGKIKCIYIDPPYNTVGDEFVYPDKFDKEEAEVLGLANLSENDFARMDFSFKSKKSHNGWLAFMYPRLLLARDLLNDDGVIFISIDDNEQANLKLLCDEIFGEENFIGNIAWESKTKSQNTKSSFNKLQPKIEYVWLYKKNTCSRFKLKIIGQKDYPESDENGQFRFHRIEVMNADGIRGRDSMVYPILGVNPPNGMQWKVGRDLINEFLIRGDLLLIENNPTLKMREEDERNEITEPFWGFVAKDLGTAESAKKELTSILDNPKHGFDTVKPLELVKKFIFHSTEDNSIILDFFAGSGTTGHAVMQLNAEDGGNRKFILCQIDEQIKEDKPAYKFCIDNNLLPVISSITIERLKLAGEKIAIEIDAENNKIGMFSEDKKQVPDIGFKVFDNVESPKLNVDDKGQISVTLNETDDLSRIYNMIFAVGLDEPTQVPEEVVKDSIYKIGNHYYITNSEKITIDDYSNAIKNGKVFIDGWTASLNGTLQNYKEDVKIVF
jgi:adenine-specific DNA-methyltransferase